MNLQQEENNNDKLSKDIRDIKLTSDEMINKIRLYAEQIEAHMDEGGKITHTNGYDMVNQIKLLLKLIDVNNKHWNRLKEKMEGAKYA